MMRKLLLIAVALLLTACASTKAPDLSAFHAAAPRSILVVPIVNRSLDVDAPNYLLATLPTPLAEKGYYVFPVNTTKVVLEQEGFYEAERIHQQPPVELAKLFGSDALLYITINRWDAKYALLTTVVTVDFDYKLVGKDGTVLWAEHKQMQYQPQNNNSASPLASLVVALVNAAITRAAPNYMPLAKEANRQVFTLGPNALPDGPYLRAGH